MECAEAREALCLEPVNGDAGGNLSHARAHVATCTGCEIFLATQAQLAQRLRSLKTPDAPPALRAAVWGALDGEDRPGSVVSIFRRRVVPPLSVLALAATLTLLVFRGGSAPNPQIDFATLTATGIWESSDERTEGSDTAQLVVWFAAHYDYPVTIPDIPGGTVTGASVAAFEGNPSAAVSYDMSGTKLTYLVVQASHVRNRSITNGDGPYYMSDSGENAVLWGWEESARMLVGDLPAEDLMRIAERCRRHERGQL